MTAFAQRLLHEAQKRLGLKATHRSTNTALRHKQVDIWTRAFELADRNGRIAVCLGVLLALSLALNIIQQGRPANVIFVDQLGSAKYFPELASPEPARDYEAENFARSWVRDFLSRDAITAKDDLARALTVTEATLQKRLKAQLLDSGELDKVRNAYVHTAIQVERSAIKRMSSDRADVQVEGKRVFTTMSGGRKALIEPFSLNVVLSGVPRTDATPNGLIVRFVNGTFGDNHAVGEIGSK